MPSQINYRWYGGAGVTVCERWLRSFWDFVADVGERPSPKHTLDRIKNERGYEPGNVRWLLWCEQNWNRTDNIVIDGRTWHAWGRYLGVKRGVLDVRFKILSDRRAAIRSVINLPPLPGRRMSATAIQEAAKEHPDAPKI